jgi:hypothetical protein
MSEKNYTLFYSNYCNFCKQFLQKLNQLELKKEFSFYCVDNNRAPPYVRSTPTLLLRNEHKNLKGKDAFDWIEAYIKNKEKNSNPLAWHPEEMGSSMSDNYSFLNKDESSKGNGESSISHSFSFLNENNANSTVFSNNNNVTENKSGNHNDPLSDKMEYLKKIRDSETPTPVQRI